MYIIGIYKAEKKIYVINIYYLLLKTGNDIFIKLPSKFVSNIPPVSIIFSSGKYSNLHRMHLA